MDSENIDLDTIVSDQETIYPVSIHTDPDTIDPNTINMDTIKPDTTDLRIRKQFYSDPNTIYSRAGNLLISFLSELLVFAKK